MQLKMSYRDVHKETKQINEKYPLRNAKLKKHAHDQQFEDNQLKQNSLIQSCKQMQN